MSASERRLWLVAVLITVLTIVILVIVTLHFYAAGKPAYGRREMVAPIRVGAAAMYPAASVTGAVDPAVTQQNIQETVCAKGYAARVRPPLAFTSKIKRDALRAGLPGTMADYELDHFIPLELGGCPTCAANLWMEPRSSPGAREKDDVENYLRRQVCLGRLGLDDARSQIAQDWYAVYKDMHQ